MSKEKQYRYKFSPLETMVANSIGIKASELSLQILEQYQIARLKTQIAYAQAHSPFFKQHLANLKLQNLNSYADLKQIPLMSSDDIYQNGRAMACLPFKQIPRFTTIRSSGTQGAAKQLYFTENDINSTAHFFEYGVRSMTVDVQRAVIYLPGENLGSIADVLTRAFKKIGIESCTFGAIADFAAAAQIFRDFQADCAIGLPSQILQLARYAPDLKPRSAFITADYIPDSLTKGIIDNWHCEVLSHYGLSECGLGGGVECPAHKGYHLRHNALLFEIIDPHSGDILPYGKSGEVVFSTLNREAMPLFRYRTGDIGSLTLQRCDCGALLPRLSKIKGRLSNLISLGENTLSINQLDELVFSIPQVLDYQPKLAGNTLKLYIKAAPTDLPQIQAKLPKTLENLTIEIYPGQGFFTTGTLKRKIIIEKN